MDKTGGQFVVVGAPGKVHQMFKVTRLNQAVGVYQDLEAACKPLSAHPAAPEG
jgi:anti-anti-sigma regulatory factor